MSLRERSPLVPILGAGSFRFDVPGALLRRLVGRLGSGRLTVRMPSGRHLHHAAALPGPEATLVLNNWRALRRVLTGGPIGFAEGYMAGDWTSPDLPALIELLARNVDHIGRPAHSGAALAQWATRLRHRANENSRRGSQRNIRFHYDLGNEFYEAWLDRSMQYSSAIYAEDDDLEAAQQRKLDRIADWLGLQGGESVLEIGIGWGSVAQRLTARHGCRVTGVTLSERQLAYANDRLAKSGLSADLRLEDYRDSTGRYDRIVSIEMVEAVGEKYWPQYFSLLRDRLAPGGRAVIQAITIAPERFEDYRRNPDFIQRHVFPGGMLPTVPILRREIETAGLRLCRSEAFGASYARTLADWRARFHAAWPAIEPLGFDARFRRMWDYYLAYCEGGFRLGATDVSLFEIRHADAQGGPG